MSVLQEYNDKFVTPEEAVKVVKSGDWIEYNMVNGQPIALDRALAARKDELFDVKIRISAGFQPIMCARVDPERKHFIYNVWYMSATDRQLQRQNLCNYIPMTFHEQPRLIEAIPTDVTMTAVGPMDEEGYFYVGPQSFLMPVLVDHAKKVLVEVNNRMPRAHGQHARIHISQVDYVVDSGDPPLLNVPTPPATEVDMAIAGQILEVLHDGCCIQLGIGGLPGIIGKYIAQAGLRHLGVHTEMLGDPYVEMYEAGCIDGSCKVTDRGKIVYAFALGTDKLWQFIDDNPICHTAPVSYVNNPVVAAQNPNLIAINSCLEIDLFSQVSSESLGIQQVSGSGGQWDFVNAGFMSKGGMGIVCLPSTYEDKDGNRSSRIRPVLSPGTVVTLPRWGVHWVATEFGMVNLKGLSTWERAEKLISIAHPDFRDELIKEADRMHIWLRSSRIG